MKQVYGMELTPPPASDLQLYRQATAVSREAGQLPVRRVSTRAAVPHPLARPYDRLAPCPVPVHDYEAQLLRPVAPDSLEVYRRHIRVGAEGGLAPSKDSLDIYRKYANMVAG